MRPPSLTGSTSLPSGSETAVPQRGALARLQETSSRNRTTVQAYQIRVVLCFVKWPAQRTQNQSPLTWTAAMRNALPCPC